MSEVVQYNISQTGRVKAAGVQMGYFFEPVVNYKANPTVSEANAVRRYFHQLRHNPPDEIRDRFLPRDKATKDMFRNGAIITRPVLKTDQGAGLFTGFGSHEQTDNRLRYKIHREYGYVIPEKFFVRQLADHNYPPEIMAQLDQLNLTFQNGTVHETQLEYEKLQVLCEYYGIQTSQNASVGREAVFFIRPAQTQEPILVPKNINQRVTALIQELTASFPDLIADAKKRFAYEHGLSINTGRFYSPIYFQADVQLMNDGNVVLDQLQLPDVGLFLSALDSKGNQALKNVQDTVIPLKEAVVRSLVKNLERVCAKKVYLITRKEVLEHHEDTLEHLEIQVLSGELRRHDFEIKVIPLEEAGNLGAQEAGLLLNINTKGEAFLRLLQHRLQDDRTPIFPDPYLLLAVNRMTQYERRNLKENQLECFHAIVGELEPDSLPKKQFTQLSALNDFLNVLGFSGDVFHIYISSQAAPIACFRYDIRGFQIAAKAIQNGDKVEIRSVPISPKQSVLFDNQDRPVYCVFRYMVTAQN